MNKECVHIEYALLLCLKINKILKLKGEIEYGKTKKTSRRSSKK